MISVVAQSSQTYSFLASPRKTDGADNSFDELLPAAETEDQKLMKNAPDKWVTEPGIAHNAVKAAVEYRESELGIKVTEPTHELTPAQREWLYSRHDFSTMKTHVYYSYEYEGTTQYRSKATAEYSNFLADLAYLGIYSADEFIHTAPIDTRPGGYSTLTEYANKLWGLDNSLMGTARAFVSHLENMWNFYNERSKGVLAVEGDAEYAELIKEHYLPLQRDFLDMLEKLFGNDEEFLPDSGAVPPIEDVSEKMKEDFGGLMQI